MEKNGFIKIFSMVAFLALMGISCWATTESLHLLLPDMFNGSKVPFWIVSILFYVLSAYGTKLIVDGFNNYDDSEHPGLKIFGGILILLLFWVIFSIPTNTHTFFYKSTIQDVLIQDLSNTKSRLQDLANDQTAKRIIDADKAAFGNKIDNLWTNVALEVNNPGNLGWADAAEEAMIKLEDELGIKIQRVRLRNNTHQGRQELIEILGKRVEDAKQARLREIYDGRLAAISSHKNKKDINDNIMAITKIENKVKNNPENNDEPTVATDKVLTRSYALIGEYMDYLQNEFGSTHKEEMIPIQENIRLYKTNVTQTSKMRSVIDVWKGLFAGDPIYKGRGLWFWVIVAIMVDVAGFIFFDIAFRKREY